MKISLIAAMGNNREIGLKNELLWHLPADMKHFRSTTMGKPILVARKTYESFGANPLPGRLNIVLTSDVNYKSQGAVVVHSIENAIVAAGKVEELMVIGGASLYKQLLDRADRLYLTFVQSDFTADSWFPDFDLTQWNEVELSEHAVDEKNQFHCKFVTFDKLD